MKVSEMLQDIQITSRQQQNITDFIEYNAFFIKVNELKTTSVSFSFSIILPIIPFAPKATFL